MRAPLIGGTVLLLALAPTPGSAQAWLAERGSATVSLEYTNILNKKHFTSTGDEVDAGHTRAEALTVSASFALTDRLLLDALVPYVRTRYSGDRPHPTTVDNGHEHGTVTDLQLALHYQLTLEPVALAPYVAAIIPTRNYETLGHAAPGRGLKEYWVGVWAGKTLEQWIPRTYLQGRYNYAFVEKVAGVSHDRSNAELEIGYFLNEAVSIRVVGSWLETHGGIELPLPVTDPLFPHHDQLGDVSSVNVGAGVAWAVSRRFSVYALYLESVRGRNGHKIDQGLTVGFSQNFGRR